MENFIEFILYVLSLDSKIYLLYLFIHDFATMMKVRYL